MRILHVSRQRFAPSSDVRGLIPALGGQDGLDHAGSPAAVRRLLAGSGFHVALLNLDFPRDHQLEVLSLLLTAVPVVLLVRSQRGEFCAVQILPDVHCGRRYDWQQLAEAVRKMRRTALEAGEQLAGGSSRSSVHGLGNFTRNLRSADIRLIRSAGNYTEVHRVSGPRCLIRGTLKQWLEQLPGKNFVQVSRGAVVNLDQVEGVRAGPGQGGRLYLAANSAGPQSVTVSRRCWTGVCRRIARNKLAD